MFNLERVFRRWSCSWDRVNQQAARRETSRLSFTCAAIQAMWCLRA